MVELLRAASQSPGAVQSGGSVLLLRGTRDPNARIGLQSSLWAGLYSTLLSGTAQKGTHMDKNQNEVCGQD